MVQLCSRCLLVILVTPLLFAMSVFAQDGQTGDQAAEIQSSRTGSNNERSQKKQLAAIFKKRIADKEIFWAQDQQPVMSANGNSAGQEKPAAPDDVAELAKKLANPVASMISFPIQTNFDFRMGTGSGWRMSMNLQPVIPFALNKDWNVISRTILPIIHQGNVVAQGTGQSGLGDIVQSFFFSPNKTEPFVWGVGPVVLVPTATNSFLGSKQLGLGPTFVILKQQHGWTVGMLYNHIWRVAGGSGRPKVNSDFIQPFLTYSTKDGWSYAVNTESTFDWTGRHWSVP